MKKTLLLLSFLAAPLAMANGQVSFLESLLASKTTPREAVMQNISLWGQVQGNYLSLGESHLEDQTATQVNFEFAKLYIDQVRNSFTFCAEKIGHFLEAEQGQWIMSKAEESLIFLGNGPGRTDFQKCIWKSNSNALTYSGFFHQYPFARPWPLDFPVTPVVIDEGNNIKDQLSPRRGMFVTQMEMSYLEGRATTSLLASLTHSASALRARVEVLVETVREVISQQVKLVDGTPYTSKYGAFYSSEAFTELIPMPKEAWFVLTNRGYRLEREPFSFLQKILALPILVQEKFISRVMNEKSYFYSFNFGPSEAGIGMRTSFAGLDLDGESELLQFKNGDTMVLEPGQSDMACYQTVNAAPVKVDCQILF
ncbi:MAG: hypothetical protein K2P81_06395 [Bacteriovoracaceae bacterium]|nr:hypothetical protein [Bacteriovoracaceae bacterium]